MAEACRWSLSLCHLTEYFVVLKLVIYAGPNTNSRKVAEYGGNTLGYGSRSVLGTGWPKDLVKVWNNSLDCKRKRKCRREKSGWLEGPHLPLSHTSSSAPALFCFWGWKEQRQWRRGRIWHLVVLGGPGGWRKADPSQGKGLDTRTCGSASSHVWLLL